MMDLLQHLIPDFAHMFSANPNGISAWFWLVTALIFGFSLFFLMLHFRHFKARMRALRSLLDGQSKDTLAASRRETLHKAQELKATNVGMLWREFDESLVQSSDQQKLFNTLDAEHFFNARTLASGLTASRLTVQTSQSIDRQRQGTELVVTAINEMSATVRDVARSTSDAAELSQQLNANTAQGRAEVESTIELIRQLSSQADQTASIIADLKRESDSISSVLDVIRGIADQTNLLALNAAIEAARAGEHGRGFAVVASEVRTLAQKTQESTGSIQDMIANLQGGADRAARSMQETLAKAQTGSSNIGRAGELLAEIADGVSAISDRNLQIATAAEEQSAVAEDINRNVVEINDVAIQVSAGAEQTAMTSLELARLAEQQQQLVGRFKVA